MKTIERRLESLEVSKAARVGGGVVWVPCPDWSVGLDLSGVKASGPCIVVPEPLPEDEWERRAIQQQSELLRGCR